MIRWKKIKVVQSWRTTFFFNVDLLRVYQLVSHGLSVPGPSALSLYHTAANSWKTKSQDSVHGWTNVRVKSWVTFTTPKFQCFWRNSLSKFQCFSKKYILFVNVHQKSPIHILSEIQFPAFWHYFYWKIWINKKVRFEKVLKSVFDVLVLKTSKDM